LGALPSYLTTTPRHSPYTTVRIGASYINGTRQGPVEVSVVPWIQ
jgi:hypothetical protein